MKPIQDNRDSHIPLSAPYAFHRQISHLHQEQNTVYQESLNMPITLHFVVTTSKLCTDIHFENVLTYELPCVKLYASAIIH